MTGTHVCPIRLPTSNFTPFLLPTFLLPLVLAFALIYLPFSPLSLPTLSIYLQVLAFVHVAYMKRITP